MAPPVPLWDTLEQICGTEETSELATAPVVSVPRLSVVPLPAKVPSQVPVWEPTLKVIVGETVLETET